MAITTSYNLVNVLSESTNTYAKGPGNVAANETAPSVTALSDGGFALSYNWVSTAAPNDNYLFLERYAADGTYRPGPSSLGITGLANFQANINLYDCDTAQLSDGQIITTWTKSGSGIRYAIANPETGVRTTTDTLLSGTDSLDTLSDVAALRSGGGFVVVVQDSAAAEDQDADLRFYNAAGGITATRSLGDNSVFDEQAPSVAVLTNGNVVVAYEKELVDGSNTFGMSLEIYTSAGAFVIPSYNFDITGSQNRRPQALALSSGSFVVAYEDNQYGESGLSLAFFTVGGALRSIQRADSGFFSDTAPTVSELANGFVVVTWTDNGVDITSTVYDPSTMTRQGTISSVESQTGQQEAVSTAALSNGTFVSVWTDYNNAIADGNTDPNGAHVAIQIDAWTRTSTSDAASDVLIGDALIDVMIGNAGNDVLYGNSGDDNLSGGDDVDSLFGGPGGDVLNGGTNFDYARYDYAFGAVGVRLYNAALNTGEALGDTFIDIEGLIGSDFGDTLYGDGSINIFLGNSGDDKMDGVGGAADYFYGGSGLDQIYCRSGADIINGGADSDAARYDYADVGLRAYLYDATQNTGFAAGDTYVEVENLAGSMFADDLRGASGVNIIVGNDGGDFIVGLEGADIFAGGGGADVFFYTSAFDGGGTGDSIVDFVSGNDRIMLDGAQFGLGSPGGVALETWRFVAGSNATLATTQLGYDAATREVWYDYNGTAGGGRTTLAYLQPGTTLVNTDIIIV